MRLAFLTHEPFFPPSGGGSAEAVYLVREMRRRGHEVHLFCPRVADAKAIERDFGVSLTEFKLWRMGRYAALRNFKYLLYPFFLERLVERRARAVKFDLIFSQHAIAAVAAGRLRAKLQVPVAMNFLDYLTGFMETWPGYLAPKPFLAAIKKFELSLPSKYQADAVLTVSDTLADYFADAGYPRTRLLPIYYGYDAELFPLRSPKPVGRPVVVMHGSFDHHHLGPIAKTALLMVAQTKPETIFRFVGQRTPALNKLIAQLAPAIASERIECTGFVPYQEVARHLASADVGIVPYEASTGTHCAFVAKIVEYLALGLPVVSTPLNSALRYFGREPLVRFSEFHGQSFGEKILAWLNETAVRRDSLAAAANARVRAELDWQAISRRAVDFVERTAQQSK
ncbi:MAG: glycosyltransferase family 4 protein [Verrucomicrobia bacterium]|nr:glycosyltransferase family 4 protein [Verrucomicrobiota bacterium]